MVSPPYYRLVDSSEDGGGGTAEGFAADDAALGIADHATGVKNIGAGGKAKENGTLGGAEQDEAGEKFC